MSRTPSFKEQIQTASRGRLQELVTAFGDFMESARVALTLHDPSMRPVLIVDDLEKIRGSGTDQDGVQRSVEQVFWQFNWALRITQWHTIWTLPPYVQLMNPDVPKRFDGCVALPMVRVWKNTPDRTPDDKGIKAARDFLALRGDIEGLFATPALLDELIVRSSGHLRDLVRLVKDLVVRVFSNDDPTVPLSEDEVASLLDSYNQDFQRPIYETDLPWLREIARTRKLEISDEKVLPRAAKLLDTHVVMNYRNGEQWFDVSAAIRSKL